MFAAQRNMGGGDDHPAAVEMRRHDGDEPGKRGGVESHCGFIEKPEPARDQREPRQCEAALLPGGEQPGLEGREARERKGLEGGLKVAAAKIGL